ncbi:hypothetical protein [Shumkonia mesophila]|uniref:hypothetical protein n=1 Tax=Shumkonia mesophila TaxID=2838854 RepID=UPI002935189E|nr:hypothetical protein [Shumkonia mesophila]
MHGPIRLLSLFLLVQALILAALLSLWLWFPKSDRFHQNYMFAAVDAVDRLKAERDTRRVILLGGSNFGFSASAETLSRQFGIPVVNLGFHARYGFENMWWSFRPYLDPARDLIVISPEYVQFSSLSGYSDVFCEAIYLGRTIELEARKLACLPDILRFSLWDAAYWALGKRHPRDAYFRDAFNAYGDTTAHYDLPTRPFESDKGYIAVPQTQQQAFVDFVRERIVGAGFRIVYVPIFIPRSSCKREDDVLEFQNRLLAVFHQPPVHDADELCYPDELFFDTWYHLRRPGVERRTAFIQHQIEAVAPLFRTAGRSRP